MSWSAKTIGELCDQSGGFVQTGPFGSQLKQSEYIEDGEGILVVMPKDINAGTVDESEIARISQNKANVLNRHMLATGDIVFPRRGEISKRGYIKVDNKYFCGTGCLKIHLPDNEILNKYLFYYLDQGHVVKWLEGRAIGSTMLNLNTSIMRSVEIKYPDLKSQKAIVSTLDSYDDLIENNKRRIELLEESARQLYKEWFVRFRFPGHEHIKIVDGVPQGWKLTDFGNVAKISKGKNITKESSVEGSVPVVAGGLTPAYYHNNSNTECPVITVSASGANAGYVNLYHEKIWASDCSYIDSSDKLPIYFLYLLLKYRQNEITGMQKGAAQPHVYPKDLMRLVVCLPSDKLILQFSEYISDNFKSIQNLQNQNKFLSKARNLLLPKLMGGEITA
jgi:type I restriction enzyme S subunit